MGTKLSANYRKKLKKKKSVFLLQMQVNFLIEELKDTFVCVNFHAKMLHFLVVLAKKTQQHEEREHAKVNFSFSLLDQTTGLSICFLGSAPFLYKHRQPKLTIRDPFN